MIKAVLVGVGSLIAAACYFHGPEVCALLIAHARALL